MDICSINYQSAVAGKESLNYKSREEMSAKNFSKVILLTNIAPHYRSLIWEYLLKNDKHKFDFYFGRSKSSGIKEIDLEGAPFTDFHDRFHLLDNIYFDYRLLWQKGIIKKSLVLKIQAAIITGDSWTLSNWIVAIILRIRGVKVIFWGHGIYGNEKGVKKWVRKLFYKLANQHLLYEKRGKELMILSGFNANKLHVVFNSLDYNKNLKYRLKAISKCKSEVYPFFSNPKLPILIFIGRLTKIKKLNLIVSAVETMSNQKHYVNTLFIGEGDEKENLIQAIERAGINDRCHFYGPCYSEFKLSKLIANADLCISPGNVGLTGIHSLSYGTPVLTHNNFSNQMPEVGVINDGINGLFFEEDDLNSLVDQIKSWLFENKFDRNEIRKNCYKIIDSYYNPKYQIKVVENLLENNPPLL